MQNNNQGMTISKMITISLFINSVLIAGILLFAYRGIHNIVRNGEKVIVTNNLDRMLAEKEIDHLNWVNNITAMLINEKEKKLKVETDDHKCDFGRWLYGNERKQFEKLDPGLISIFKDIEKPHYLLHSSAINIQEALNSDDQEKVKQIYMSETVPSLIQTQDIIKKICVMVKKSLITDEIMVKSAQYTRRNVSAVGIIAFILLILSGYFITQKISASLRIISKRLNKSSEYVYAASLNISSACQMLAEGASQQAVSVEQITSSLEEVSSMSEKNADNAKHANSLRNNVNNAIQTAKSLMQETIEAMDRIKSKGENTGKIVKTIDEIAFQTNLLALNAATEAARAGETGAGFAVVANEVRNLAMRSAEAAKNTQNLIKDTINEIDAGSQLVIKTSDAFIVMTKINNQVADLIGEILVSSEEQSRGIVQVSIAANEIDKVTQQNAAGSEQSASTTEELRTQSIRLKKVVDELLSLIGKKD